MLYTTGDLVSAVRLFLGLARGSASFAYNARLLQDGTAKIPGNDKLYLDDFRVAYSVSFSNPCLEIEHSTHGGT